MLIGLRLRRRRQTVRRARRPPGASLQRDVARHHQTVTGLGHALTSSKARDEVSSIVGHHRGRPRNGSPGAGYALVFLGFISLVLAVINLFPFLPLDGGHILWARGREGPRPAHLAGGDVPLQLGGDHRCCCSWSSTASATTSAAWRADAAPSSSRAPRSAPGGRGRTAPRARARRSSEISSQLAGRAEAPVAPAQPDGQPVGARQQRVRLDRERERRRLHEPAPARPGAARAANAARRAGGTCSITLEQYTRSNSPSANGSPSAGVGAHERPRVVRAARPGRRR